MNRPLKPGTARSLIFNLLARTTTRRQRFPYSLFWDRLYRSSRGWKTPIATVIHDRDVIVNFNYTYPIYSRQFASLNNPLVEVVNQMFRTLARPLRMVDIGAAVGDTVLLVEANCPGMVSEYICIDGDAEFFDYLEHNLGGMPNCRRILQQLSRDHREGRTLVRTHGGTASAQGNGTAPTAPLDDVLAGHGVGPVDVLKIDVDGFDGEVLAGAAHTLEHQQPAVIFEWHPKLCQQTSNDAFSGFAALCAVGYDRLVWFTKYGTFSHYGTTSDRDGHARLLRHCLTTEADSDCHFDVVAIPNSRSLDEQKIADLQYAVHKRSPW